MSAAKWHREQAAACDGFANRYVDQGVGGTWEQDARSDAAHHATAADALEALAVPGVAGLLDTVTRLAFVTDARDGDRFVNEDQRAALSRLAKIASEGK